MRVAMVMLVLAALCVAPLLTAAECVAEAKPEFAKIDKDADGSLTAVEFDAYVEAYPELGIAKGVFTEIDVNQDGSVTAEEFTVWAPIKK